MAILCPFCSHAMSVKQPRAGQFTPRCSRCGQTFQLRISLHEGKPSFATSSLVAESAAPPVVEKTVAGDAPAASNANFSFSAGAAEARDPEETAALFPASTARVRSEKLVDDTQLDPGSVEKQTPPDAEQMPASLAGYQIVKELGRGGMGTVYLARQVSLDRPVALKVMNTRWASNPNFLVRFTREAYAAAQLIHHNVVQVYDIGEEHGIHFFSMEFVQGRSLGDLLRQEGRLAPEVAAGYLLQAARGLKFAHDRGMIHRDIKPDNLLLNDQGVVKVADLGLVRTPSMEEELPLAASAASAHEASSNPRPRSLANLSNVTMVGQAVGTAAYMAPEQGRDATKVDHRADIYSLGCTLYVLVTGRPVFQGSNALEVITKHAFEPVVRPDLIVKDVPRALADIIVKMVAKNPEDRYPDMAEVIQALESFLGVAGKDKQAQTEQHIRTLEQGVKAFRQAPAGQLRSWVLLAFFGGCSALCLFAILFGAWRLAGGALGLLSLSALSYLVVHGTTHRTPLLLKFRDLILSSSWLQLGKVLLGVLLFVGMLALFQLFWIWFLAGILGIGLALGMHYALDRRLDREHAQALEKVERLLRTLRVRGLSEEALQEFVARHAGEHWEEFFEALFGYEAKLTARQLYGRGAKGLRPRHAAWRDPVYRWLDRMQKRRQEERERRHLQNVEQKNLQAQGLDAVQAKQQADAVAAAMVRKAMEIKKEEAAQLEATVAADQGVTIPSTPRASPPPRRVNVLEIYEVAATPPKPQFRPALLIEEFLNSIFGSTVRFLIGITLVTVCLVWLYKNGLLPSSSSLEDTATYREIWSKIQGGQTQPLPLPLPKPYLELFCSLHAGLAGVILLFSSIWRSWKIGFLVLLGAGILVFGPLYIPALGPLSGSLVSLVAGAGVSLLGFLIGRDT